MRLKIMRYVYNDKMVLICGVKRAKSLIFGGFKKSRELAKQHENENENE